MKSLALLVVGGWNGKVLLILGFGIVRNAEGISFPIQFRKIRRAEARKTLGEA